MAAGVEVARPGVTIWFIWECLKPEVQAELRALMPLDWEPPSSNHRRMKFAGDYCQMESLEEIDKLMRWRPRYLKGVSFAADYKKHTLHP